MAAQVSEDGVTWATSRSIRCPTPRRAPGSLHAALTAPGTTTSDRAILSGGLYPLYAFGFEIQRSGGTAGHTAFALVQGTFALY